MTDLSDDLQLALHLADRADVITMSHFRSRDLVVTTKPDMSEVTVADKGTESALVELLASHRPGDSVLGEEHGSSGTSASSRRWVLDPIDGTSNYVRGVPVWATLIALEIGGLASVGVVSAPALGRRWWAARGRGAFANGESINVSAVAAVGDAFLSYSEGPWHDKGFRSGIDALRAASYRQRAFGDFWQHLLVAEGAIDVAAEVIVNHWDVAPLVLIVEEAGGRCTDLAGVARADGGSVVSTNGRLHDAVLAMLNKR